MTDFLTEFYCF